MNMTLYQTICSDLKHRIVDGSLKAGDKIYSINEMKLKYNVSPITAMRVYKELSAEGVVNCRRGQGYYVCDSSCSPNKLHGCFGLFVRCMRAPSPYDNYYNEINTGIQLEAANRRINLFHHCDTALLNSSLISQDMLVQLLNDIFSSADHVDGFLLDAKFPDSAIEQIMAKTHKPIVVLDRCSRLPINAVCTDHAMAMRTILDIGKRMKYTQFVFCTIGNQNMYTECHYNFSERDRWFRKLASGNNFEIVENYLQTPWETYVETVADACHRQRRKGRVLLICATDSMARNLAGHFFPQGCIDADFGIATLEGLPIGVSRHPRISSMKIDSLAIGVQAVGLLQQSINEIGNYAPLTVKVPPTFLLEESMN